MTADLARAATLRKFNPGALQDDEEIIRQFVVRGHQLNLILEVLRENLGAASNQHLLVVAPRGRGKTMLLARVAAELRRDPGLAAGWLPVRFMEESMEVLGIADFWLECLLHLANALNRDHPERAAALRQTRAELAGIMAEKALEQRARAAVLDVTDDLDRRLVLMVENLQDLASDTDRDFGWQLRKVLQGEPRIMLLASATCRFAGLDQADQPFFETLREIALPPLDAGECRALWQVATGEAISEREIAPLRILTGGSPRLLIFIAGFARHHSMRQLMEGLVTLIDDHTEYFRGHLEAFAPKERKVYLALIDLWQPSSAREVAVRARMDIRPVSSLLGRLVGRGAVIVESAGGKQKQYGVAERLYSIYYKLRRERNEAAVVQGLVHFMTAFYTGPNLQTLVASLAKESREAPGIRQGLMLAMRSGDGARERLLGCLSFDDYAAVLGTDADTGEWIGNRFSLAYAAYSKAEYDEALGYWNQIVERFGDADEPALKELVAKALVNRGVVLAETGRPEEALASYAQVVERFGDADELVLTEQVAKALFNRGVVLAETGRPEEALASYAQVVEHFGAVDEPALEESVAMALVGRGLVLAEIGRPEEALASYAQIVERFGDADEPALMEPVAKALVNRGVALAETGRPEEALTSYAQVVQRFGAADEPALKEPVARALVNRGVVLEEMGRPEEALATYGQVVERFGDADEPALKEQVAMALVNRGADLAEIGRPEEALASYAQVVERFGDADELALKEQVAMALVNRGIVLAKTRRPEEALATYAQVVERFGAADEPALEEGVSRALVGRALTLAETGRPEEALASYAQVVERFGGETTLSVQELVAPAVRRAWLLEDPQAAVRLYVAWYRGVPVTDPAILRLFQAVTVSLFVSSVPAERLLEILESIPEKSVQLRPLILALRQENGEQVRAPTEILEVAADVRKQMKQLRESQERESSPGPEAET